MRRAGASALKEAARLQRIKAEKKKKRRVVMAIIGSIAGAVLIIVIVIVNVVKSLPKNPATPPPQLAPRYPPLTDEELRRINCFPEQDGSPTDLWNISYEGCKQRGCEHWRSRNPYAPVCYMPPSKIGYRKYDMRRHEDHGKTEYFLRRLGSNGIFANTSSEVTMTFFEMTNSILRMRLTEKQRTSIKSMPFKPAYDLAEEGFIRTRFPGGIPQGEDGQPLLNYKVETVKDSPFSLRVMRAKEGVTYGSSIWSTELGAIIYSENFFQLTTALPRGARVYGIGEHRHVSFRRGIRHATWSLFARNQPPDWMLDSNLYGAHPFVMVVDPSGLAHGILYYNAAPAEISVTPYPSLIWRAIGGMPDVFIFVGPTPDYVMAQYTQTIGRTMMPPRWLLGLHVCFSGARNLSELASMKQQFDAKKLPWSVLCLRKDADESLLVPELEDVAESKKISLTFSPIVPQPQATGRMTNFAPYVGRSVPLNIHGRTTIAPSCFTTARSNKMPFWITRQKNNATQTYFFLDPMDEETVSTLVKQLQQKRETVRFDMLHLDDNQPYIHYSEENLTVADCYEYTLPYITKGGYLLTMRSAQSLRNYTTTTLSKATICMSALHRNCSIRHLDIHNAYGTFFAKIVNEAWHKAFNSTEAGQPFISGIAPRRQRFPIMSSATFPGHGRFGGHWMGRTSASWSALSSSVMSVLEMNWFGVPLVGDTICGEDGPGSFEMCSQWASLAAFYPLVRFDFNPHGRHRFMALLNETKFLRTLHRSLTFRAYIFPYFYSVFYDSFLHGLPVWKPLFHLFAGDKNLADEYQTFMMGDGLLIAPVLTPSPGVVTSVQLVPGFRWFHLKTSQEFDFCSKGGETLSADHKIDAKIVRTKSHGIEGPENVVYLRGGSIVTMMTEVTTILDFFSPATDAWVIPEDLQPPTEWPSNSNTSIADPLHVTLLVSCDCLANKRDRLARGTFFWEVATNESSVASMHVRFLMNKEYMLESKMLFTPVRRPDYHPPGPSPPWEFEVIIDHIFFYGVNVTRFFPRNQPTTTPSFGRVPIIDDLGDYSFGLGAGGGVGGTTTTESTTTESTTTTTTTTTTSPPLSTASTTPSPAESIVKVVIKQTVGGDKSLTSSRESVAVFDWRRQVLVAANIAIPLSDGDFSVALLRPQSLQQTTTPDSDIQ